MATLSVPFAVTLLCWFCFEIGLLIRDRVRNKARAHRDRGTRFIVAASLSGAIVLGWMTSGWVPALATPAPHLFALAGLAVVWLGLAVRAWAVLALGRSFTTYLQVEAEQAIVSSGPYRWVRHPSYTGLLLIGIGFGIAAGNWLSMLICVVVPFLGLLPRIAVEESQLLETAGERYRIYRDHTHRLVPGLW